MRVLLSVLVLCAGSAVAAPDGAEVYRTACAACHGADGRGTPLTVTALEIEPPDLTDCSFSTREADADWLTVVHAGGPARAFAREMPAFGEALDRGQLQRALDHARRFCGDARWPHGNLNFPRALATEKAYPEDEVVITTAAASGILNNKFIYEQRVGPRSQLEIIVPFGWREDERPDLRAARSGGVGDVAVGMKHVLHHSLVRGSIVSVAGEVKLPTGSERRGFGGGTAVLEPFLAFGQALPRRSFLHAQAGAEIPLGDDHSTEGFLRIAGGKTFRPNPFGRSWTPMVELLAAGSSVAAAHWDVLPQMQVSLSRRQHVFACAGVRLPLNERRGRDSQFVLYLLWDWFDGGLTDGW